MDMFLVAIILIVILVLLAMSIRIANQWERVVVLYLGRFVGIRGPGLFFIIPILNRVAFLIDIRVLTTSFNAEQTLTKDTVPVNVDAVLFWQVIDVEKAALEVKDYKGS
ncbi:MAG: SPFH domain-containing protein, partial [Methanoregula sp.]